MPKKKKRNDLVVPEILTLLARNMAAKSDFRTYLQGVYVEPADKDIDWTRMIATDGNRMTVVSMRTIGEGEKDPYGKDNIPFAYPGDEKRFGFILSTDSLVKHFGNAKTGRTLLPIKITEAKLGKDVLSVKIGEHQMEIQDGTYPDWRKVAVDPVHSDDEEKPTLSNFDAEHMGKAMDVLKRFKVFGCDNISPIFSIKYPSNDTNHCRMQLAGKHWLDVEYNAQGDSLVHFEWTVDTYIACCKM